MSVGTHYRRAASSASSPSASCWRAKFLQANLAGLPERDRGSRVQLMFLNTIELVHPSMYFHERPEGRPRTGDLGDEQGRIAHVFRATLPTLYQAASSAHLLQT